MNEDDIVWSSQDGDMRKKKIEVPSGDIDESQLVICLRRLTSGKGRTIIELTGLPANKKWCQKLAKDLKKAMGVGGAYKNDMIEIHGEKLELVQKYLIGKNLKTKKIGG